MLTMESSLPVNFDHKSSAWEHRLVTRNIRGARVAIWLVLVLYPTFGILDYLMARVKLFMF